MQKVLQSNLCTMVSLGKWLGDHYIQGDRYRVFSHDVTAAILVSQNNEMVAMLVSQTSPLGVELFSYANIFFCSHKFAYMLATWVKTLYIQVNFAENIGQLKILGSFLVTVLYRETTIYRAAIYRFDCIILLRDHWGPHISNPSTNFHKHLKVCNTNSFLGRFLHFPFFLSPPPPPPLPL